jgi:hypothetical protein
VTLSISLFLSSISLFNASMSMPTHSITLHILRVGRVG